VRPGRSAPISDDDISNFDCAQADLADGLGRYTLLTWHPRIQRRRLIRNWRCHAALHQFRPEIAEENIMAIEVGPPTGS
jgi:hypothetical protein